MNCNSLNTLKQNFENTKLNNNLEASDPRSRNSGLLISIIVADLERVAWVTCAHASGEISASAAEVGGDTPAAETARVGSDAALWHIALPVSVVIGEAVVAACPVEAKHGCRVVRATGLEVALYFTSHSVMSTAGGLSDSACGHSSLSVAIVVEEGIAVGVAACDLRLVPAPVSAPVALDVRASRQGAPEGVGPHEERIDARLAVAVAIQKRVAARRCSSGNSGAEPAAAAAEVAQHNLVYPEVRLSGGTEWPNILLRHVVLHIAVVVHDPVARGGAGSRDAVYASSVPAASSTEVGLHTGAVGERANLNCPEVVSSNVSLTITVVVADAIFASIPGGPGASCGGCHSADEVPASSTVVAPDSLAATVVAPDRRDRVAPECPSPPDWSAVVSRSAPSVTSPVLWSVEASAAVVRGCGESAMRHLLARAVGLGRRWRRSCSGHLRHEASVGCDRHHTCSPSVRTVGVASEVLDHELSTAVAVNCDVARGGVHWVPHALVATSSEGKSIVSGAGTPAVGVVVDNEGQLTSCAERASLSGGRHYLEVASHGLRCADPAAVVAALALCGPAHVLTVRVCAASARA